MPYSSTFFNDTAYCFGGSLPLNKEISRRWEWLSWQIGIKGIFIRVESCKFSMSISESGWEKQDEGYLDSC